MISHSKLTYCIIFLILSLSAITASQQRVPQHHNSQFGWQSIQKARHLQSSTPCQQICTKVMRNCIICYQKCNQSSIQFFSCKSSICPLNQTIISLNGTNVTINHTCSSKFNYFNQFQCMSLCCEMQEFTQINIKECSSKKLDLFIIALLIFVGEILLGSLIVLLVLKVKKSKAKQPDLSDKHVGLHDSHNSFNWIPDNIKNEQIQLQVVNKL